jgi:hypothetical protein
MNRGFLITFFFLLSSICYSAPLGTVPTIEETSLRLITDFRSDFWTSPYKYKSAPVRILEGKFRIPVIKSHGWTASLEFESERFGLGRADVALGSQRVFIAQDLRSESMGFGINKTFENGDSISFFNAWATASDHPYASKNSWAESFLIFRSRRIEDHRWIIGLNQSNNRGILNGKPFIYAGLQYDNDDDFAMSIGFPFFRATWGAKDEWRKTFVLTYFGSRLEVEKDLQDGFVFKTAAWFSVRSFLHDDRENTDDRLYYQEICLEPVLKKNLSEKTHLTFGVGYSFDRRLYETRTIYRPNNKTTQIENDAYTRVGLEFEL